MSNRNLGPTRIPLIKPDKAFIRNIICFSLWRDVSTNSPAVWSRRKWPCLKYCIHLRCTCVIIAIVITPMVQFREEYLVQIFKIKGKRKENKYQHWLKKKKVDRHHRKELKFKKKVHRLYFAVNRLILHYIVPSQGHYKSYRWNQIVNKKHYISHFTILTK